MQIYPLPALSSVAPIFIDELRQDHSVLIFAPTGSGGHVLAQWLSDATPEFLTPERLDFDGLRMPNAPSHSEIQRFSVRRDLLGEFLVKAGDQPETPFICLIQARGPVPKEEEIAEILKECRESVGCPLYDPSPVWPEKTPENICVIALSPNYPNTQVEWKKMLHEFEH